MNNFFKVGTLSVEHLIEKRDLHHEHTRKARDAEDIELPNIEQVVEPDTVIETQKEILSSNNYLTDIILTRVEFHRGKPVDAIKLQSITFPGETNQDGVDTSSDLVAQAASKESITDTEHESEPPKETEEIDSESEKLTEPKADVEQISNVEEKKNEEEDKKEELQDGKESQLELSETKDEKVSGEVTQGSEESSGVIENRETLSEPISDHVEAIPVKPEPLVELTPKPIETPGIPVSPLPQPIYIPLYTDAKIPAPIPVQPVVSEVVVTAPPVVVVTEKEVVVAPPPPPVQTETTVIQTEQTPDQKK
ncbi:pollen-specific leucine-rich repeat extensin-like protein 2 [Pieris rapae]|uniref:pollen-specific leucine-rich repeat extensin-like protein 2 n=1 Tax=Pieris rapae TaxID=64459 RepID=UPI001E27EBF7|nr:pollen-specific leucine-rich repeat extensin-like protein 2 [Pieris rapae]